MKKMPGYYSLREAAQKLGVSPKTVLRWVNGTVPSDGIKIKAIRDRMSGYYYISEKSVAELANRFENVEPASRRAAK